MYKAGTSAVFAMILINVSMARKVKNIYWDTNAANMRAKPLALSVKEHDQVNIICPVLKPGTREGEQHIIYSVEKEEFENCRITNPKPKIVAICNKPQMSLYFTLTFRSFSPTPGGLEFTPGKEYFFISTSSSRDIHSRAGGWCSSHNMKMVFKVQNRNIQPSHFYSYFSRLADSNELPKSILARLVKNYKSYSRNIKQSSQHKRQSRNLKNLEFSSTSTASPVMLLLISALTVLTNIA